MAGENPQAYPASVTDRLSTNASHIKSMATAAGVDPTAVAAPLAREDSKQTLDRYQPIQNAIDSLINARASYGYNVLGQVGTVSIGWFGPLTDNTLMNDHLAAKTAALDDRASNPLNALAKASHPTKVDVGYGNIKVGTAIDAVADVVNNAARYPNASQLGLNNYHNRPASLVKALINDPKVNIAIQAVVAKQANDWFAARDPAWVSRPQSEKSAFITGWSARGRE